MALRGLSTPLLSFFQSFCWANSAALRRSRMVCWATAKPRQNSPRRERTGARHLGRPIRLLGAKTVPLVSLAPPRLALFPRSSPHNLFARVPLSLRTRDTYINADVGFVERVGCRLPLAVPPRFIENLLEIKTRSFQFQMKTWSFHFIILIRKI